MIIKTIKYLSLVVFLLMNHNPTYAKSEDTLLVRVNDYWNSKIKYTSEKNKEDNWLTPIEIKKQLEGDCEDYAIAKYMSLIAHGVNPENLYLMWVILSNVEQRFASHIVLIYKAANGKQYVLDNYSKQIIELEKRTDFSRKIATMNLDGVKKFVSAKNFTVEEKWTSVLSKMNENIKYLSHKVF